MSYHVTFAPREAFATVALSGRVSWNDLAAALCLLFSHPAWHPSCSVLWDTRAIRALQVAPTDLPAARGLMEALASARAGGRSAVLVENAREATLAATLADLGPPTRREVQTFEQEADALRFLGRRSMPEQMEIVGSSDAALVCCAQPPPLPLHHAGF